MAVTYSQNGVIVKPNETSYNVIGGRKYKTVVMPDGKEWLAENLDFKFCQIGGQFSSSYPLAYYYNNNETTYGWNGYKCGLLYNGYACNLLESNKNDLIPGWHVPSKTEWENLIAACGGVSIAGTKLKSVDENWFSGWNGTDDYGFKLLPAGAVFNGEFGSIGENNYVNTSTDYSSWQIYYATFDATSQVPIEYYSKGHGHSLRLVRDVT